MVAAGGTGGHVYPALAILEAVQQQRPDVKLAFVGGVGGFERDLLDRAQMSFAYYDEVQSGPLHGVGLAKMIRSAVKILIGTAQAYRLIGRRKPSALLLTGGWEGFPVALAAWLRRLPSMIFLPDIEPALSIKALRPLVTRVAATTAESAVYFNRDQFIVTGYPLRGSVANAARDQALQHFQLDANRRTLLAFGGSRGARSLNYAVSAGAADLLADGWQIIHVTGSLDYEAMLTARAALPDATHYHLFAYLHDDMGLALAAADLCVCRSGASTLGELPYFGLPAILVPYPHAWRYQKVNADYLTERGAALTLADERLSTELVPTIRALAGDPARLAALRDCALALRQPDGAANAAAEWLRLAERRR